MCHVIALAVVAFGLFFGLLFGLLCPEFLKLNYVQTTCHVDSSDIIERYVCNKECSYCLNDVSAYNCESLINNYQQLDPEKCANNTDQCPKEQTCGDGYKCCYTTCSTCQRCSTTCSNGRCNTNCTLYTCNCICTQSVQNNQCKINCVINYSGALYLSYKVDNETIVHSSIIRNFDTDYMGAAFFTETDKHFKCFYDPNDVYSVFLKIDFKGWYISIFLVFGVTPMLVLCGVLIKMYLNYKIPVANLIKEQEPRPRPYEQNELEMT